MAKKSASRSPARIMAWHISMAIGMAYGGGRLNISSIAAASASWRNGGNIATACVISTWRMFISKQQRLISGSVTGVALA